MDKPFAQGDDKIQFATEVTEDTEKKGIARRLL